MICRDYDKERLEVEEEVVASQEREAHLCAQEAYARRMRLRKHQKALKTRGVEMLHHGLKSLDELDEAEEKECREAEVKGTLLHSPSTAVSEGAASDQDLFVALSPGFFDRLGVDGETPPVALDS
ncbi:hypothetical protein VC83_07451 [Pseudogymnoascus destructans]|uniref:Uncharacterized protein n=1 Tax=Pseudogymnoascus destructans TaxID=655981 RepID=A0A177A3E2_9PEZI|nr:uncharacterized protein VC83_07451 [Pseudogymnoascus destructans]OAF56110.1 hypothetical protein VC83_07451 [Pseudogymnoascus destructans]